MFRSEQDVRLYIVKDDLPNESSSASASVFDQLNLFDNTNDVLKRMVRRTDCHFFTLTFEMFQRSADNRRSAIDRFSKVTHFLRDTILGQDDLIVNGDNTTGLTTPPDLTTLIESVNGELKETTNDGFEVIYKVFIAILFESDRRVFVSMFF